MSTSLLLGVAGAGVGSFFGMPGLGYSIGSAIGSAFGSNKNTTRLPDAQGPRLNDLRVQGSAYGEAIPIHFGANRLAGSVIWAPPIVEHVTTTTVSSGGGGGGKGGGGGGGGQTTQTQTTYTYTASLAVLLCRGPVSGFGRIWLDGTLFYDARGGTAGGVYAGSSKATSIAFYTGDENQLPDPTIQSDKGYGNVPAYRGSAYVVLQDIQIDDYGRRIPNVTVEVFKSANPQNGKKFDTVVSSYFWGDPTSSYSNVFTAMQNGVLRVLNQQDGTVRLLNTSGQFIGYTARDPSVDAYGDQMSYNCGRLNGYSLAIAGNFHLPFSGINPYTGVTETPPQIWVYPNNINFSADFQDTRTVNVLSVVADNTQVLLGFVVSADQRRAMIICGRGNYPFGSNCTPETWYLIYLNGNSVTVEASGSAVGFPAGLVNQFGVGNRAGLLVAYPFYAGVMENDYKHVWVAYGSGSKPVDCYRVEPTGVTHVFSSATELDGFAYPSIMADSGMCWVTNRYKICVFTRMQIATAGNPALSEMVSEICQLSKLTADDVDVSLLNGTLLGYTISRQTTIRSALQQLMSAYFFDAAESGGKIKFIPRGIAPVVTIEQDDLAVHAEGNELPDIVTVTRQQDLELPKRVNITYVNTGADYQPGAQYAARIQVNSVNENTLELPIVMSDDQAAQIADTMLYGIWMSRETHQFSLGMEYLYLEPGDVVVIQTDSATFSSRLTSVEMGAPGILLLQGTADDSAVYTSNVSGSTIIVPQQTLAPSGPTELHLMDIPIVRNIDDNPGFYAAASGYYDGWKGASLIQSPDGAAWNQIKVFITASTIGIANTILGNGLTTIPDQASTVNVRLLNNEQLSSITDSQLLAGGNLAVLGSELIQFRDAILQSDGTYNLSYFLRGRFGTEWATASHVLYEEFTLLTESTVQRVVTDSSAIGSTKIYKAVTLGMSQDATLGKHFTNRSIGLKPYSPVQVAAKRDSSLNVTFNWIRRTRVGGEWRDNVDVSLGETTEAYEVDVIVGTSIVRTISSSSQSANYTTTQQTSDGLTLGQPIHIKVYQLSTVVGRGYPAEAIV